MNQREQKTEEAVNAAWSQFQKMPSSNPGDYAHAILRALERFEEANTPTRDERVSIASLIRSFEGWSADEVARFPQAASAVIADLTERLNVALHRTVQGERSAATTSPDTVYMRPFHQTYPGTTQLFHTYCSEHPAFGICGDEEQARADVAQHRAVHAATEGGER